MRGNADIAEIVCPHGNNAGDIGSVTVGVAYIVIIIHRIVPAVSLAIIPQCTFKFLVCAVKSGINDGNRDVFAPQSICALPCLCQLQGVAIPVKGIVIGRAFHCFFGHGNAV